MNLPLVLLLVLVIPLVVIFIIVGFRNLNEVSTAKQIYVLNVNQDYCYPNGILTNLQNAGNKCCAIMGQSTNVRPINYTTGQFPIGVTPDPIPAISACYPYCEDYNNNTNKCQDTSTNKKLSVYDKCIYYLTPSLSNTQCTSLTVPLAYSDSEPLYGTQYVTIEKDSDGNITKCNDEDLVDC